MPRPREPKMKAIEISTEKLLTEILPKLDFSLEELIMMLSNCHDHSKNFLVTHKTKRYEVSISSIEGYFKTHKKPERRMSVKEENEFLKKKLAEVERKYETVAPEKARAERKISPEEEHKPDPLGFNRKPVPEALDDEPVTEPAPHEGGAAFTNLLKGEIEAKRGPASAKKTGKPKATAKRK